MLCIFILLFSSNTGVLIDTKYVTGKVFFAFSSTFS